MHDDFLGELPDDGHFVGDQDDGHAEFAVDVGEQIEDRARGLRVERRGRLVRQQHARPRRQRAGNADALLLAAGEFGRVAIVLVGDTDKVEQFGNARR